MGVMVTQVTQEPMVLEDHQVTQVTQETQEHQEIQVILVVEAVAAAVAAATAVMVVQEVGDNHTLVVDLLEVVEVVPMETDLQV